MSPAHPASLVALVTAALLSGTAAMAQQVSPRNLPQILPQDHSDTTETHGCLCDDWLLGLFDAEGEPIALASIDPRDWTDEDADAGSLAETRHLNNTLQPRLLRVSYRFDLPEDEARLLLASSGAQTVDPGTCRIRAVIENTADIIFPDLTYLASFDWTVPADEVENRIHLAGLAPITGAGFGGPTGVPGCTGPTDEELRRFFTDGAPILLAGPLPPGGTVSVPLTPPPRPTPAVLTRTPPGGGGTPLIPTGGGGTPPGGGDPDDPDDPDGPDDPGGPTTPIPLPASLWLLLAGLGILAGGRLLGRRTA